MHHNNYVTDISPKGNTIYTHMTCHFYDKLTSLVGKSQTLPYFPNCPPKILTLLGTNAAHLNAYSSAVKLLTVRPNSGSSLLVNGKLLELFATTCKYAIRSAMGKSNCT